MTGERLLDRATFAISFRVGAIALCLIAALGAPASADPRAKAQRTPGPDATEESSRPLTQRIGVPVGVQLIAADDPATRLRGVVRLGTLGTPAALEALVAALEPGSRLVMDPKARLAAMRVLAPHAKRDEVRAILTRELSDLGGDGRPPSPLSELARDTAAFALARTEDKRELMVLMAAILQGGPGAASATRALRAYPPPSLEPLLDVKMALSPALITLLGDLGDLRALGRLRSMLAASRADDAEATAGKEAVVLALAKLGDGAAAKTARAWLRSGDGRLAAVSARALAMLAAPDAPEAIRSLLVRPALAAEGLRLALDYAHPRLASALLATLATLSPEDQPLAVSALGRAGGPEAIGKLSALLGDARLATPAAFALATLADDGARAAIEAALAAAVGTPGARRRLIVRAATVRELSGLGAPSRLGSALGRMLRSTDPADRAVGAFGLVSTGRVAAAELATSKDDAVFIAAARGALSRGGREPRAFLAELRAHGLAASTAGVDAASVARTTDAASARRAASGVALLADPRGDDVSTSALAAWAESASALAPLAARALPSRDNAAMRGRLKRLLASTDAVVRAHAALGLARDPEPDSAALLASAYQYEEEPSVRRAIVRALSARSEVQRQRTLQLAQDLDPDEGVRALARSALAGRELQRFERSAGEPWTGVAWVTLTPTDDQTGRVRYRAARLTRSDGLTAPVVADPDGVLIVAGLPVGHVALELAPDREPGDARAP